MHFSLTVDYRYYTLQSQGKIQFGCSLSLSTWRNRIRDFLNWHTINFDIFRRGIWIITIFLQYLHQPCSKWLIFILAWTQWRWFLGRGLIRILVLITGLVVTVYCIVYLWLILKAFSSTFDSITSFSLSFSESHLFLLCPGPSFLYSSLQLPLDQILCPGSCLDVRSYMLASTIWGSHPMFLEIDLLFHRWQAHFAAHQRWPSSFCQYKLHYYSWQFLPMSYIILHTWQSFSLLDLCWPRVPLISFLLFPCYLTVYKYFWVLGQSHSKNQHSILL